MVSIQLSMSTVGIGGAGGAGRGVVTGDAMLNNSGIVGATGILDRGVPTGVAKLSRGGTFAAAGTCCAGVVLADTFVQGDEVPLPSDLERLGAIPDAAAINAS